MDSQRLSVHPLVLMGITEHYTRALYRDIQNKKRVRVIGLIMGVQKGRILDCAMYVELKFDEQGQIDEEFAQQRIKAYKQKVYAELDVVGWYSATQGLSDDTPSKDDVAQTISVVQRLCGEEREPLMFVLNMTSQRAEDMKAIPLFCYEISRQTQMFVPVEYTLAASDSEQTAVEVIHYTSDKTSQESMVSKGVKGPLNAVKMLRSKLNFLIKVVESSPEVRANHGFMRRLNQIVTQTPIASKEYYDQQVLESYSETQLLNMMASVTKSCGQIQELIETFTQYQKVTGDSKEISKGNVGTGFMLGRDKPSKQKRGFFGMGF